MHHALHVGLLVLAPTALYFLIRAALPALVARRLIDNEFLLATVAIAAFGQSLAKTTGFPREFDWERIMHNPVQPVLILVGLAFCVLSVRAYRLERLAAPPAAQTDQAVRDYVRRYADHFQIYGLGLALILLGV
jgi:hypothetical protein